MTRRHAFCHHSPLVASRKAAICLQLATGSSTPKFTMTKPREGRSRKQTTQLKAARAAAVAARSAPQKENLAPLSPSTKAAHHHQRRADAAEAEIARLKQKQKNAARRERRQKKKNADLNARLKAAEKDLQDAVAHGEAEVTKVLKKRSDHERGWQRRLNEAQRRLEEAESCRVWSTAELKKKLDALSQRKACAANARQARPRIQG
ncbi:hypothetical protein R3P38DRAFT_2804570 [Favolaschia claudopus]|uniref:Uncharacterized protein n=1 Tax=Favolaschia claudopus TaxID=2862362 RepID=A0AAV9ZQB6_9AGAR